MFIGLVDTPNARKSHNGQVPLVGGIAIFFSFLIGLLLLEKLNGSVEPGNGLISAISLLVFAGVLDDYRDVSWSGKLIIQIIAALLICLIGKTIVYNLGNLLFFGNLHLGPLGIPFTIIATVGVINSINMIDGLDGLAGSVVLVELAFLAALSFLSGNGAILMILMVLICSILGFLCFNFPYNKDRTSLVFMGDAGSMLLGATLVWASINLSQGSQAAASPVTFLWFMAIPLFDMISVTLYRVTKEHSPFGADNEHLHHLLRSLEYGNFRIVIIISSLVSFTCLVGIISHFLRIPDGVMFVLFFLALVCYMYGIQYLRKLSFKKVSL